MFKLDPVLIFKTANSDDGPSYHDDEHLKPHLGYASWVGSNLPDKPVRESSAQPIPQGHIPISIPANGFSSSRRCNQIHDIQSGIREATNMIMRIVCAWCGKEIGEKKSLVKQDIEKNISHSMCKDCLDKEISNFMQLTRTSVEETEYCQNRCRRRG